MLNEMVRRKVKTVANLGVSCFYNHVLMCFFNNNLRKRLRKNEIAFNY